MATTNTNLGYHTVVLDAAHDLAAACLCSCDECCDAFAIRFQTAADKIAIARTEEGRPTTIRVSRVRYGSPEAYELSDGCCDLWQEIHDSVAWSSECGACGECQPGDGTSNRCNECKTQTQED